MARFRRSGRLEAAIVSDLPRPVVLSISAVDSALLSPDGGIRSITGLWTAARQNVPCRFVIVRNGAYQVLKDFAAFLGTSELPGMNLPGIDFVSIAAGYGVPGRRVSNAVEMADALKAAINTEKPSLLEVQVEPTDSGTLISAQSMASDAL